LHLGTGHDYQGNKNLSAKVKDTLSFSNNQNAFDKKNKISAIDRCYMTPETCFHLMLHKL
jgi:hypothetical protein